VPLPQSVEPSFLLPRIVKYAIEAGQEILGVYATAFSIETKADDSPLTQADRNAHDHIARRLSSFEIPLLSEEGREIEYRERQGWNRLWIVDPLDGTREFVNRNGEFTVNIALVEDGRPILGVVYVPVKDVAYFGARGIGSWRMDRGLEKLGTPESCSLQDVLSGSIRLPLPMDKGRPYTIVGSRSHQTPQLQEFVAEQQRLHPELQFLSAGSSLKFCLVAEGAADIYPRLGPTMEWDTAAGQAVVEGSGGKVLVLESMLPLLYNRENLRNPDFIVTRAGHT
jgi:3'(2'), 5'-bisphosphate nucleotidase